MTDQARLLALEAEVLNLEAENQAYLRTIHNATETIMRLRTEREEAYRARDECREQISWTTSRCNDAMGEGFSGTAESAVAAVCDTLKVYRDSLAQMAAAGSEKARETLGIVE